MKNDHLPSTSCDWEFKDAGIGLLMFSLGVLYALFLVGLIKNDHWFIIAFGGFGWLSIPILLLIGGNSIYQGLRAGIVNLRESARVANS